MNFAIITAFTTALCIMITQLMQCVKVEACDTGSEEFKNEVNNNWKKRRYIKVPNREYEEE